MFGYTVSLVTNEKIFYEVCKLIELSFSEDFTIKDKILEDVDGTLIQIYIVNGKKIKVLNDYEVDAVYIDSEVILSEVLGDKIIIEYTVGKE